MLQPPPSTQSTHLKGSKLFDQASTLRKIMSSAQLELPQSFQNEKSYVSNPEVLVVTGGKGGVGKSVTSANLALCISQLNRKVLLVDTDLGLANLDVLLGTRVRATIEQVLSGEARLSDVICSVAPGLHLIPASSGSTRITQLDKLKKLTLLDQIESLDEHYDTIIFDTAAGLSSSVQNWAAMSSQCLVVCTPEPTSLADAYATMKILHAQSAITSFRLIVNMVTHENEALRVYDKLASLAEEYLGVNVTYLGSIPFDETVRRSVRERSPFMQRYPFSLASSAIRGIASELSLLRSPEATKVTSGFFWQQLASSKEFTQRI
jgi:flagellar biosynthesis protein FlhG